MRTKLFFFFIIILLNCVQFSFAQQTIVTEEITDIVCRGNSILVPFIKTGTFEIGNNFTVQIKTFTEKNWTNLVTEGVESPLKAFIPTNYSPDDSNNSTFYFIRIVASKPNIIGKESMIPLIYSKPQVSLFGATQTTVNPYSSTTLKFRGTGSSPFQIVLNDSSKITIAYPIYPNSDYYSEPATSIFPSKSGNYTIAYSENMCGRSDGTGSVAITVNEISLKALRPENLTVCVGGVLRIPYSTNGRKMNVDNKFKIGLKYSNTNTTEIELDAIEKDGFVEVHIPENFQTGGYNVTLMSSSPVAKSAYSEQINIREKSFADFQSQSITINLGQEVYLPFNINYSGPWSVTLNDGSIIGDPDGYSQSRFKIIKPEKSAIYSISSFKDQCGVGSVGNSKFQIIVNSGVVIDSLQQSELCVGGNFSAKYSTKGDVNISNLSAVLKGRAKDYIINVPSTFEKGIVKVNIPQTFFSDTSFSDAEYSLGIKYNNYISYSENYVRIKNKPNVSFANTNPVNLENKGIAMLPILVMGGSPLSIQLDDFSNFSFNDNNLNYTNKIVQFPVQVLKSSIFRLKSISNSCGTTLINDGKIITVNVKNKSTFGITINNAETRICAGSKMKVNFNTLGEFGFDNVYKVELFKYNYDRLDNVSVIIGEGKTSPIEVTIPTDYGASEFAYLRVISNNPNSVSEFKQISINTKPVFSFGYSPNPIEQNTVNLMAGEKLLADGERKVGLLGSNVFAFSDGTILLEDTKSGYTPVRYTRTFTQNTVFGLNSVSNECGQGKILSKNVNVNVIPYMIVNLSSQIYNKTYCTGENIVYTYNFTRKPYKETSYNLQIASTKDSIFTDIGSKTNENPVIAKIPVQFKTGTYFIRLVSNSIPKITSNWTLITIDSPLTVNLSTFDDKNTITVEEGKPVTLKYNYSNKSAPSFVTISDEFNNIYTSKIYNPDYDKVYTQIIYPTKTSTFTIKSVENACGYGISSGSVKIITTPTLIIQKPISNVICANGNLKLKYSTTGNYPADNIFKFLLTYTGADDNNIQKIIKFEIGQTTALSGEITLKIPSDIPLQYYQLEVLSSNPNSSKIYEDISLYVSRVPDVTVSGGTSINAGSGTYLNMINKAGGSGWYVLSDSVQGKLYYSKLYVSVNPSKTTTYKILSLYNECGIGKSSGSATVTVNPVSEKKVYADFEEFSKFPEQYPYICAGATYPIKYRTVGEFSQTNKFTVQVSDENGENFKDVVTEGTSSPLKFITPDDMKQSDSYRIRVVASDKDVSCGSNYLPIRFSRKGPTAMFDSSTYLFTEGKTISIKINLTGRSSWSLKFGSDDVSAKYYQGITASPYIINVSPIKPTTYKIFDVNDGCPGKTIGKNTVKIELITANEELSDFEVKLFPNPTPDKIIIQNDSFKNTTLQIFDNLGRQILEQNLNQSETILDLSNYINGQYLLQLQRDNKRVIYKIQKL